MAHNDGGLKILAGAFRGRKLFTPNSQILRPMRAQVRMALFNSLGPRVDEASVLDLFAGSGSLGLEALSRGAGRAVFVDRNPACLKVLERNVALLGVRDRTDVVRHDLGDGVDALRRLGPFGLVLVHPPFALLRDHERKPGDLDVAELLQRAVGLLEPDGRIAFETPRGCYTEPDTLAGLEVLRRKDYGSTTLFIAEPKTAEPEESEPSSGNEISRP